MRILFSGMVAGDPGQGGASWAILQYVLGLRALGHEVLLVEPVERIRDRAAAYFRRHIVQRFSLEGRAALLEDGTGETVGVPYRELARFADGADLLINVSGMLRDPGLRSRPMQVYLDLDPGFNQLWHEAEGLDAGIDGHERYLTVGLALGSGDCPVPTCGKHWITTLPPVLLDLWPRGGEISVPALTSVGNWRAYGSITHEGVHYGQKAHSLREIAALPERVAKRFLLAYAIHPDEGPDLELLARNGWELADPLTVAGTPDAYASFVRGSEAEIGIAKSGYVKSRGGWFSDRSACYLASGRPVLAQETGFSSFLPVGEGLLSFADLETAAAGVEAIASAYERHAAVARQLAEELFDSRRVLTRLLDALARSG